MAEKAKAEGLQAYQAGSGHLPPGLLQEPRPWTKAFLAASVIYQDTDECAEGVKATVASLGQTVGEGFTDNYGDLVAGRTRTGQGTYTLTLSAPGYKPLTREVTLAASLNLGQLFLEKA